MSTLAYLSNQSRNKHLRFWLCFALSIIVTVCAVQLSTQPWRVDPQTSMVTQFAPSQFTALIFPFANPFLLLRTHPAPWRLLPRVAFLLSVMVQFPLYGLILGLAQAQGRFSKALMKLLVIHGAATVVALPIAFWFPQFIAAHLF